MNSDNEFLEFKYTVILFWLIDYEFLSLIEVDYELNVHQLHFLKKLFPFQFILAHNPNTRINLTYQQFFYRSKFF